MQIKFEFSRQSARPSDPLGYLCSFAEAEQLSSEARSALLGVEDSLRQARLVPDEPLGAFACITAEEEAATFLFCALQTKGYRLPISGQKLRNHVDKAKLVLTAQALAECQLLSDELKGVFRLEDQEGWLTISHHLRVDDYVFVMPDPLGTITTRKDDPDGQANEIASRVETVLATSRKKGFTDFSNLKDYANKRNLCIYGAPKEKARLQSVEGIESYQQTCVGLLLIGFMIFGSSQLHQQVQLVIDELDARLRT